MTVPQQVTAKMVLDALLAGNEGEIVQAGLDRLPSRIERQSVLCTACGMRAEAAASCQERGDEITAFLSANCLLFELGQTTCELQQVYGLELESFS